jgi:HAD superfamily hydrolase (TIGR01662 family)
MNQTIRAILFDLGDTLMHSIAPWPPVYERASRNLARALCKSDIQIDIETFHIEFCERLDQYYVDRERNLVETSTMTLLKELLAEKGYKDVSSALLRAGLDEFYSITQQNWLLEDDAIPTLKTLKEQDYRIGLVSNAGDNRDVFQLVEKFDIEPFFDFILTSAACGYRKPHPRIFEMAITHWGYLPDEIAMVGDRLDADISGARPLGIFTIWIRRRTKMHIWPNANPHITVDTLEEIPQMLIQSSGT